jgi:hypothetical protein
MVANLAPLPLPAPSSFATRTLQDINHQINPNISTRIFCVVVLSEDARKAQNGRKEKMYSVGSYYTNKSTCSILLPVVYQYIVVEINI